MTKARIQLEHGLSGKYLSEAIGAVRTKLQAELEGSSRLVKGGTLDDEGTQYFKDRIGVMKAEMAELQVVEAEAMRAAFAAFRAERERRSGA